MDNGKCRSKTNSFYNWEGRERKRFTLSSVGSKGVSAGWSMLDTQFFDTTLNVNKKILPIIWLWSSSILYGTLKETEASWLKHRHHFSTVKLVSKNGVSYRITLLEYLTWLVNHWYNCIDSTNTLTCVPLVRASCSTMILMWFTKRLFVSCMLITWMQAQKLGLFHKLYGQL